MSAAVLLDAGPLGMVSNPSGTPEPVAARQWLQARLTQATHVSIPEIADYEVRRELLRVNKSQHLARFVTMSNQERE